MSESIETAQDVGQCEEIIKRPRGRPKKPVIVRPLDENPPKRGRPRKPISEDPPPPKEPKPPKEYKWKHDPRGYVITYYYEKVKCKLECDVCHKTFSCKSVLNKHKDQNRRCNAVKEKLELQKQLKEQ